MELFVFLQDPAWGVVSWKSRWGCVSIIHAGARMAALSLRTGGTGRILMRRPPREPVLRSAFSRGSRFTLNSVLSWALTLLAGVCGLETIRGSFPGNMEQPSTQHVGGAGTNSRSVPAVRRRLQQGFKVRVAAPFLRRGS